MGVGGVILNIFSMPQAIERNEEKQRKLGGTAQFAPLVTVFDLHRNLPSNIIPDPLDLDINFWTLPKKIPHLGNLLYIV